MTVGLNTYDNVSAIANAVQEDALLVARASAVMPSIVTVFTDLSGKNPRNGYEYNSNSATTIGEADDLNSTVFEPSLLATLTPSEIGKQYFITDARAASELPEMILRDAATDLGLMAADKMEGDLLALFPSLTGGTVGASGTTLTWGHFFAAASRARVQMKQQNAPLYFVCHEYQWFDLAKAASVAGVTIAQAPAFTDLIMSTWYKGNVGNIAVFVTPHSSMLSGTDAYAGMFPRSAIAYDVRRPMRIEAERDASRRGVELNMSALYACGVWRASYGVQVISDATAPTE